MFRFFRRDNLRSTRRRSASCPNLEQASIEDEIQDNNAQNNNAFKSNSESDSDEEGCTNKFERLNAQRSIRRDWLKEKEKKENTEKNLICMDDYLGKLSELKTWLKEERKKDVDNMSSPKLKVHFKTFVKLWNKRKLPLKYYKGFSVNLDSEDKSCPSYSDMVKQPVHHQHSLVEDCATTILPPPFDLSREELLNNIGSPFSTFGKSDDLLTSPAVLAEKVNVAAPCVKQKMKNTKESSSHKHKKYHQDRLLQSDSPPKFATISRSIPAISRLYKFTAQPWTSSEDAKIHPIPSHKGSELVNNAAATSFSSSPSVSSTFLLNFLPGEHMPKTDAKQQSSNMTKSPGSSPVYSSIVDAIPYSTGSPKYAEIEESIHNPSQRPLSSGYCSISPSQRPLPSGYCSISPSQRPLPSGYCSLSPLQEWRAAYKDVKQAVSKKQSLSRRRSKSMEYLYSVPFKDGSSVNVKHFLDKEDKMLEITPPIPERKYSPTALFSTSSELRVTRFPTLKDYNSYSRCHTSFSKTTSSPISTPVGSSPQKRQSPEGIESVHNMSSLKRAKSNCSSNASIQSKLHEDSVLSTQENEDASPLSILTGSLNPTTRSKYKLNETLQCSETRKAKNSETRLSILEIKQLDESPKLARRKMKRRSSSLSTTPGKRLTFGKASKMSVASPRRVSFAKNVKETENKTVPRKSIYSHHCVTQNFTKQTQERKEFESFMSFHETQRKKSNSPNKVPSPDKNSSLKSSSPIKQNSPQKYLNVTPLSKVNNESQNDIPRKSILFSRDVDDKGNFSQLSSKNVSDAISTDRIFPASSARQVGRRVIGAPKASPNKNCDDTTQVLSPKTNLAFTSQVDIPQKNLQNQTSYVLLPENNSKNSSNLYSYQKNLKDSSVMLSFQNNSGTKNHLTSQIIKSTHQIVSPQKNAGVTSQLVSPQKNLDATSQLVSPLTNLNSSSQLVSPLTNLNLSSQLVSPQKNIGATSQLVSPQKNMGATSQLVSPQKNMGATSQLVSPPKSLNSISQLVSHQKKQNSTSQFVSLQKNLDSTSQLGSLQKNHYATSSVISTQKNIRHASRPTTQTVRSAAQNLSSHKHLGICSPRGHLRSPPKSDSQLKGLTSQTLHSMPKKCLDMASSVPTSKKPVHSLVAKLTEKTASICAKDLSESDDCLSSEETLNVAPLLNTSEILDTQLEIFTHIPVIDSQSQELHKETGDFEMTILDHSPGICAKGANYIPISSETSCAEIFAVERPDANSHHMLKELSSDLTAVIESNNSSLVSHIFVEEISLQAINEMTHVQSKQKTCKFDPLFIREMNSSSNQTTNSASNNDNQTTNSASNNDNQTTNSASNNDNQTTNSESNNDNQTTNSASNNDNQTTNSASNNDNQTTNSASKELNNQVMHTVTSGFELEDKQFCMTEVSINIIQPVSLPVIDLAVENKGVNPKGDCYQLKEISSLDHICDISNKQIGDSNTEYEKHKTDIQTSDVITKKYQAWDNSLHMDLKSKYSTTDSINSASADSNESHCDLKRLASIRASPKIVDNDGWITERRRSSRGKNLQSFRSAYNRHLLKSSSKDNDEGKDHSSEEKSLDLTSSFLNVDIDKNICLQAKENIPDLLSQNLNEILNVDMMPDEKSDTSNKTNQTHAASLEVKCIANPIKAKPPTLPKPSKALLLMNRKPNAANSVIINTGKIASKRPSLTGRRSTMSVPKGQVKSTETFTENDKLSTVVSIQKVKCSERLSSEKDQVNKRVSSGKNQVNKRVSFGRDQVNKRVSSGRYKSSTRKPNEQDKCLKANENCEGKSPQVAVQMYTQKSTGVIHRDSNKFTSGTQESPRSQKTGQTTRKRNSNGVEDHSVGRRRSKMKNMDEDNKTPSFADRRNFFRQLHTDAHSGVNKPKDNTFGICRQVTRSPHKLNQQLLLMGKTTNEDKNAIHETKFEDNEGVINAVKKWLQVQDILFQDGIKPLKLIVNYAEK